jgi:hypothetical protein
LIRRCLRQDRRTLLALRRLKRAWMQGRQKCYTEIGRWIVRRRRHSCRLPLIRLTFSSLRQWERFGAPTYAVRRGCRPVRVIYRWDGPPDSDGPRRLRAGGGIRETLHPKRKARPIERLQQRARDRHARARLAVAPKPAHPNPRTIASIEAARHADTTKVDIEDL